ncbi:MAG TPA: SRPBCC family protein [Gaiellaceae bacterium]|nr:SRPBCC family protein [Gaiellaceae bacterium]
MTHVEGVRRFAAPPERVFALLTDPSVIAAAVPAVRGHRVLDADHWEAKVKPPLPFAPSLTIRFEVTERRPPSHAGLRAHGGGADVASTFDLAADGEGGTVMRWRATVGLGGLLRRFGGHGLETVARHQADRTLDAVERAL